MESLKAAISRLDQSVGRLETVATLREAKVSRDLEESARALADARADQAKAQETADTVSKRLEAAIARLESVLGN